MFHCFIAYVICILFSILLLLLYIFIFLHFPLSGPVLTYISLLIIPGMIVYVTNNKEPWTKDHRDLNFPDFYLSGQVLNVCITVKYLGNFINNEMSDDDDDMYRQRRKLYAQANMLVRKFYMCSDEVNIYLLVILLLCGLSLRKRAYVSFRLHTMIVWGSCWKSKMVQCKWFIL